MEGRSHAPKPRGINAVRAGMYAGEGESIGYGHVRSNLDDIEYASSVDESEFNSEEETDPEAVTRGWIVDTVGTSESFHVREKSSYSGERRLGDYYNRRSSSSTSTLRSPSTAGGNLFRDGNFAEFHVHRDVLRFRSPVFRQMLKDSRMNIIEVADTEAAVMEELLKFIYTGSVSQDSLTVFGEQLLAASSKYEMLHLKGQCEDVLSASLTADNALRLLYLADSNRALALKNNVCQYAQKEYKEIFRTPYFVQFQTEHPKLSNEFMTIIFAKPAN
jgi:speckle-type POZ protein